MENQRGCCFDERDCILFRNTGEFSAKQFAPIGKKAKLSQEALAEKADLSPVYISRVECGKENISVDAAMRICQGGGSLRLQQLFRGTCRPSFAS